jgi:hypothetical protein
MTRARTLTQWGIGISAAVVLTACGGGGEDDPEDDRPASASYGLDTLMPAVAKAVGEEDYVHLGIGDHRGRAEVQVDLAWADEPELRALTGDEPGEFLEFRRVSGRMYVGGEAADNTWTWLPDDDPRALGEDEDFDSGAASVLLALDVPGDYEALVDAVDKVQSEGEEEVAGVAATHYVVTVDSQAWRDALPEHSVHRQFDVEDALLLDLWIDEASLPVRLEYSGTDDDDARIDYTNWGTPVAVVEPEDARPVGTRSS